jgi:hypothetical protein
LKIQAGGVYLPNAYSMVSVSIYASTVAGYHLLAADGKYHRRTAAILGR